jgi:hypothetical protein
MIRIPTIKIRMLFESSGNDDLELFFSMLNIGLKLIFLNTCEQ